MSTLRDVAALAGVSPTTVSIVVNGKEKERRIPESTVKKVLSAMKELGYQPNQSARALRGQKSARPSVVLYWPLDSRNHMLGSRISNMQHHIAEKGYDFDLSVKTYLPGSIAEYMQPVLEGRHNGVLIGGPNVEDLQALEALNIRVPLVLLNRDSRKYSSVSGNNAHTGIQLATLLQKKQATECALIHMEHRFMGAVERTKSFLYTCSQFGIEIRPEWQISGPNSISGGVAATERFCALENRPRYLVYESDCMAQGGLYALHKNGIRVPQDVELLAIGTQEAEHMAYLIPSVSCVSVPINIDRLALDALAMLMRQDSAATVHLELEPLVQLRESFQL